MLTKRISCPSCAAPLKIAGPAPEEKIRCPKCRATFRIPTGNGQRPPAQADSARPRKPAPPPEEELEELEELEEEPRPKSAKAKPRKPAQPPDDDEELDEEPKQRPKSKKKRFAKKQPASKMPLIVGLALGGVLVLGGVSAGVYWLVNNKTTTVAQNAPPKAPAGPAAGITPIQIGQQGGRGEPATEPPASNAEPPAPAAPDEAPGSGASADFTVGKRVFAANCARCHALTAGTRTRGPNLSAVGRDPSHTADWLVGFIKDPASVKPGARMPPFDGKIDDADLQALAEYLASLK